MASKEFISAQRALANYHRALPGAEWLLAAEADSNIFILRANGFSAQRVIANWPHVEWMGNFSFKKTERLAKRPEFEKVMNEGKKKRVGRICIIFSIPNGLGRKRLGIIASKKVGNAVARNLVKRRIRETFRHIKHRMEPALDIVVISSKDMVKLPYRVIEKELSNALLAER